MGAGLFYEARQKDLFKVSFKGNIKDRCINIKHRDIASSGDYGFLGRTGRLYGFRNCMDKQHGGPRFAICLSEETTVSMQSWLGRLQFA